MEGVYRVMRPRKILGKNREVDDILTDEDFDKAHVSSAVIDAMVSERILERSGQTPEDIGGKLDLLIAQNERMIEMMESLEALVARADAPPRAAKGKGGARKKGVAKRPAAKARG